MDSSMHGKICVITGASRGIGKAIASLCVAGGAKVYCLSRSDPGPGVLEWIACDVGAEGAADAAIAQIIAAEGRIDVLVNNAGITRDGLIMRMKTDDWDQVLHTNLWSAFYLSRAVSRHMLKQRSGVILNVSSIVGVSGNAGQANYAASKAGLIGLTKSLAKELAPRGVRVNAIAPGYIETSMTDHIPAEYQAKIQEAIPLGRTGTPEEVAQAALFLCSDAASYITGVVLHVDGGMGM